MKDDVEDIPQLLQQAQYHLMDVLIPDVWKVL